MDLMYLSESFGLQSRTYPYGRDEQCWVNINEKTDKPKKEKINCTKDVKNCSICKNRQKRLLADYIRKTRRDSDRDTFIEEEEEEEEEEAEENEGARANETTAPTRADKPPAK